MVKRLFACVLSITTAGVPPKQILKRPKQFHLITQMALVILTLSVCVFAYAEAPMDQIYQYVEEQLGYTREELTLNQTAETEETPITIVYIGMRVMRLMYCKSKGCILRSTTGAPSFIVFTNGNPTEIR